MESITINIRRCKDCHHWESYEYDTEYIDGSIGWCKYKGGYTFRFDACIETSDLEKDMPYALYSDTTDFRAVCGLW
jgi:hypothetical protein